MILVAFAHALRATEVIQLTPDNFHDAALDLQRLKGSLRTIQPLIEHPNELLDERKAFFAFLPQFREKQRIFPVTRQRFWQLMQEHGEAAGLPAHKRHPHVLKHSMLSQMIESAGIHRTRQYGGHKNISSTGEYLKVTDDDASSAAAEALKL